MRVAHTLLLLGLALAAPATAHAQTRSDFTVDGDPGIRLHVRRVQPKQPNGTQVILVHGARVPGIGSFDLPVPGGSLAMDLAAKGFDVYVPDLRNYGGSTRDKAMAGDPAKAPSLTRSNEAVRDLAAVTAAVRRRSGGKPVAILGWATGGHWAGMFASLYPEQVGRLVLLNSLYGGSDRHPMVGHGSGLEDPKQPGRFNPAFGGYRVNGLPSLYTAWDNSIPLADKDQWRAPEVAEAYGQAALASDPLQRPEPVFRSPSGAMEDSFYQATGRQLWDASTITAPILIVRGGLDFWSRPEDAATLAQHAVHAARVERLDLPQSTHLLHLDRPEHGRAELLEKLGSFLRD